MREWDHEKKGVREKERESETEKESLEGDGEIETGKRGWPEK